MNVSGSGTDRLPRVFSQPIIPATIRPKGPALTDSTNVFNSEQDSLLQADIAAGAQIAQAQQSATIAAAATTQLSPEEHAAAMLGILLGPRSLEQKPESPSSEFPPASHEQKYGKARQGLENALRDKFDCVVNPAGIDILKSNPEDLYIAHHNMLIKIGRPDYIVGMDEYLRPTPQYVSLSTQPEPIFWAIIEYYENDTKVGGNFQVPSKFNHCIIDGGLSALSQKRFCLNALPTVNRNPGSQKVL